MCKITQTFECLLHFFQFFRAPTYEPVGPIFAFNVIRRGSAQGIAFWGLENLNLKFIWLNKSQKSKFYDDAYGKFLKNFKLT